MPQLDCILNWMPICVPLLLKHRWLTQKGVRQKKLNEWLGIKNENQEEWVPTMWPIIYNLEHCMSSVAIRNPTRLSLTFCFYVPVNTRWWMMTRICRIMTSAPGSSGILTATRLKLCCGARETEHSWFETAASLAATPVVLCMYLTLLKKSFLRF